MPACAHSAPEATIMTASKALGGAHERHRNTRDILLSFDHMNIQVRRLGANLSDDLGTRAMAPFYRPAPS
jgi:hypothetical protein